MQNKPSEKKGMGVREAQLRAMREARVEKNKSLIDKQSKAAKVAKVVAKVVKTGKAKRGGRGR